MSRSIFFITTLLLSAACGSPFETEQELTTHPSSGDSAAMSQSDSDSDAAGLEASTPDAHTSDVSPPPDAPASDVTPKDSGSPEVWHPDAGPPPDTAAPAGNACVISIGENQYQVSLVPSSGCPSTYTIDWESPCEGSGECSCDTCTIPWPAGCSCFSCTLGDATSCVPGTPCTVSAPDGLNAIPVGSMIGGTCQYVTSPNEGA
jgi:hypothetical protein